MAELIDVQNQTATQISRIVVNLKKKGEANITEGMIDARVKQINILWTGYSERHVAIVLATKTDAALSSDPYFKGEQYEKTMEVYMDQCAWLYDFSKKFSGRTSAVPIATASSEENQSCKPPKLPHTPVPSFGGSFTEWPSFRDYFTAIIMQNHTLSDIAKLHHLRGCLTGDAAKLLRNLPSTGRNFQQAWDLLKDRYENRRILVNHQLAALAAIPTLTKESAEGLKRLSYDTLEVIAALTSLDRPITDATDWLVFQTVKKLDPQSLREWETALGRSKEPPSFDFLAEFLESRIQTVETLERKRNEENAGKMKTSRVHQVSAQSRVKRFVPRKCDLCPGSHYLGLCETFQNYPPSERRTVVQTLQRCFNCLGKHQSNECNSVKRCQRCADKHHTSLHDAFPSNESLTIQHTALQPSPSAAVMLGTARVQVLGPGRTPVTARALIDPGSEVSLITESLVQRLGLKRRQRNLQLLGVGGANTRATKGVVTVRLESLLDKTRSLNAEVLILPQLSGYRPVNVPHRSTWPHIHGLQLADPRYRHADAIDLILGADLYGLLLRTGVRRGGPQVPVAQDTVLGWILTGGIGSSPECDTLDRRERRVFHCSIDHELTSALRRFWEQEEVIVNIPRSPTDEQCEEHFRSTYQRSQDGRFVVRLPFTRIPEVGDSRFAAARNLQSVHQRFRRSEEFRQAYHEFMREYEQLGHMVRCQTTEGDRGFYLPHHGVYKANSTTTKLRVVFNGSLRTSNGKSLNDYLHSGPNLLPALADVLLRWRQHAVAFTADVEKMYRQILVDPDDRRWQRILWAKSKDDKTYDYELCTVTYGLACAPYLAIRCLRQLAEDEIQHFPLGGATLLRDVYMDDVLTGASTIEEATHIRRELYELLMAGGFRLRKWASNSSDFLDELNTEGHTTTPWTPPTEYHSVLGIQWSPNSDSFQVIVSLDAGSAGNTKRAVLSKTARIFDPLGWLSPVTVTAKILMQSLWLLKSGWDTPLPRREEQEWKQFLVDLPSLNAIRIPRWLNLMPSNRHVEIHGFADASENAFTAVVYLRVVDTTGATHVKMVTAKSKVAPLQKVSIPRLELSAATLAMELVSHTVEVLELTNAETHMWVDSSVALGWIRGHPTRWKTYVANRVAKIQQTLPQAIWHHVKGSDNPADCASRGLSPAELPNFKLWWQGPTWLQKPSDWPQLEVETVEPADEAKPACHHVQTTTVDEVSHYISRYSNLSRLFRVTAWCWRWKTRRRPVGDCPHLNLREIHAAKIRLVRAVQETHFATEIQALNDKRSLPAKSRLTKLNPILDEDGLLRVGGRLRNAAVSFDQKYPLVLPDESPLAQLWVQAAHRRCLHGGVQLTLATLRQECWILRGRPVVKAYLKNCVTCIRWRAQTTSQLMGNLPRDRVTPYRPFIKVGIDYAGPILLRSAGGRGHHCSKGYIALFVCLATKALHLEVVSDGTTETFLVALRRFVARRGVCSQIYSDCGTNFIGANRELKTLLQTLTATNSTLFSAITAQGIEWKFNPPAAPYFGGLWEAGVKSVKHHLRRQLGDRKLTYEELTTLLTGIEACLNSRPLEPLSDDPEDLEPLTPGHFLIGGPLTAIPEPDLTDVAVSRLNRWQLVQQLQQHFWRRWSQEYLNVLQTRNKWQKVQASLQIGDLCLIKHELLPPTKWPLARVVEVQPGADGLTRVVTVQTPTTTLRRPVTKIVGLLKGYEDTPTVTRTTF